MSRTIPQDVPFVIVASLVFFSGLTIIGLDFVFLQNSIFKVDAVTLIGFLIGISGATVRRIALWTLGKEYSYWLRTYKEQKLVTSGIFKRIRHPTYLGTLISELAIPIFFQSVYGFIVLLLLIPCFLHRIKKEEEMLLGKFGEEYQKYVEGTKKLIPFIY